MRKLIIENLSGVDGEVEVRFSALTTFIGTCKLSYNMGELLCLFSDKAHFERTRQPRSTSTVDFRLIPVTDDVSFRITTRTSKPRVFTKTGKLRLTLSDAREFTVLASNDGVEFFHGDTKLPVFFPVLNVVAVKNGFHNTVFGGKDAQQEKGSVNAVARFFGLSLSEMMACFQGLPTDNSLFGYEYELREVDKIYLRLPGRPDFCPLAVISGGEVNRFVLDVAARIALYSSKIRPTILVIDRANIISLDQGGWTRFFEWTESNKPPYQVVIDGVSRPSDDHLKHALCYEVIGDDMAVKEFRIHG